MGTYTPPPLDVIRERMADMERRREAEAQRRRETPPTRPAPRKRQPRRSSRLGRPHSDDAKQRFRESSRRAIARKALADPTTSDLRRARIEREWTMRDAATACGLHFNTILQAETTGDVSDVTWDAIVAVFGPEVRP